MTTQMITINPSLLIDLEGTEIPFQPVAMPGIHEEVQKRSSHDYAAIRNGRMRRMFNRHAIVSR